MMKLKHARKGQMVTSEYVLLFFVVVAGISAMTLYVQRGLQARHRDGKIYMVDMATQACTQATAGGVDCLGAAKVDPATQKIAYEYEPYYGQSEAEVRRDSVDKKVLDENGRWGKYFAQSTQIGSDSAQLPPAEAAK